MTRINEDILSEINGLPNTDLKMKDFLKWLIEFERLRSDKDQFNYKNEIEKELDDILIDKSIAS